MLASEMIEELKAQMERFGDKPVRYNDGCGEVPVQKVEAYTGEGNIPKNRDDCDEFFIH